MRLAVSARTLTLALGLAALGATTGRAGAQSAFAAATPTAAADVSSAVAAWTGVYRISLAKGTEVVPARVVVERIGKTLDATVLVGSAATSLARLQGDGGELRAEMVTSSGRGQLVLRTTATGVVGTLTVGKTVWEVTGERSA